MARNKAYRKAEKKIDDALRSGATELDLSVGFSIIESERLTELPGSLSRLTELRLLDVSRNQLTMLPEWLGELTELESLDVSYNQLTTLPEWLGQLAQLGSLDVSRNQLTTLPEWLGELTELRSLNVSSDQLTTLPDWLGQLTQLQLLNVSDNQLTTLPESLGQLTQLQSLSVWGNALTTLPDSLGNLTQLRSLDISFYRLAKLPEVIRRLERLQWLLAYRGNLSSLPDWMGELRNLEGIDVAANHLSDLPASLSGLNLTQLILDGNPLNPELEAAYEQGLDAVKRYLRAKAAENVVLNEAKLILIGEGEVGKSCLLGALRDDDWVGDRDTTHGIEIKPVKVTDKDSGTDITLNGWDFGGQRVYRPTHQLFFSAPAVYLVVWKPREGPQQGFVKDWIQLVKHREPDAKILVVATHGGPGARQPDIDRQEIWDLFGRDRVVDFFHVESKPPKYDERLGKWTGEGKQIKELRDAIARIAAGLPEVGRTVPKRWYDVREALEKTGEAYLPLERVLKICDEHKMDSDETKDFVRISHRLGHLIHYEHDPALREVVVLKPDWLATAISFVLDDEETRSRHHGLIKFSRLAELWGDKSRQKEFRYPSAVHPMFVNLMERFDLSYRVAGSPLGGKAEETSLIAQLVPDLRPEPDISRDWRDAGQPGDEVRRQICQIVDTKGQSANAEGLFFQLIVRLHRFSLGRAKFKDSVHWQRGLILDDDYNGRAFLEHSGNDVLITVRAPYPENFLSVLTHEVKWLVENFWEGLRCDVMVPCIEPCGRNNPGTGLFEVEKLIDSKRRRRPEYPCQVCNEWQSIDSLLRNAPAARPDPVAALLENFESMKHELAIIRPLLTAQHGEVMRRFDKNEARILSQVDDAFTGLMRAFTDEAKEGPRLFSLQPVERSAFNPQGWAKKKFRVTLWCEHTRLPLPLLNGHEKEGVYEFDVTREWFVKAAPFLKVLAGTLSLMLPVAASTTKLVLDETVYKTIENQLDFGKDCAEAMLTVSEKTADWFAETHGLQSEYTRGTRAHGGVLRDFQTWLKKEDPSFGDLRRVLNKRQEFLWVHRDFEKEY